MAQVLLFPPIQNNVFFTGVPHSGLLFSPAMRTTNNRFLLNLSRQLFKRSTICNISFFVGSIITSLWPSSLFDNLLMKAYHCRLLPYKMLFSNSSLFFYIFVVPLNLYHQLLDSSRSVSGSDAWHECGGFTRSTVKICIRISANYVTGIHSRRHSNGNRYHTTVAHTNTWSSRRVLFFAGGQGWGLC